MALAAASLIGAAPGVLAGSKASDEPAVTHTAVGIVKKVDSAGLRITLRHEPIAALGWPAMTMPFAVKDRKILESLRPDQKVEFTFVQNGGAPVITAIR
jgi:Cu(I)/Ag(I) efflux system periplasmic protein CusF